MENRYIYTNIRRCNAKQVHVFSYLQIQWETGTHIQLFTDTMRNRYTDSYLQIMRNWCKYKVI